MTAVYDKLGLHFLYPENWKLLDSADPAAEQAHVISLESPDGSSTWIVHAYPPDIDREQMIRETIGALEETYEDVEIAPIEESLVGQTYQGIEAMFYCLDFLIRARLVVVPTEAHTFLLWSQAEDRDFDKQAIVFQAIATSLLSQAS